jgi:hypothetical protein
MPAVADSVAAGSAAKDRTGRVTAQAAPAPNNWANLRRELEMVFIDLGKLLCPIDNLIRD